MLRSQRAEGSRIDSTPCQEVTSPRQFAQVGKFLLSEAVVKSPKFIYGDSPSATPGAISGVPPPPHWLLCLLPSAFLIPFIQLVLNPNSQFFISIFEGGC
ncbi:hypothetical protein VF14_20815 [Nostoc linckia z18]|uniref:Uncharacterized protein n=2 Tax=Nostoc linckia TaxID=92942 RepID=A0A9Q5ZAQ3_NOSLI|nr:hypothetical protein VF02_29790 [Nostoc linckia z1]PHJ59863.1 hypothetical protein VF05_31475 [Nostoc linckia z3]PHJ64718.1 hypothetical protein VF03_28725 [Nostoc linckia z2]PHJ76289.1 hypothetical protein VF06_31840 [Nostoc linckia z4]PHJ81291.1 hypothetical protein VF07_30560 [Nostoc linckia z6]PHJ94165.1 hypothetical protein VF04_23345 [Nostoc linckia z7]PHK02289.1 hypothetical protein VF08_19230 [Nostoc linckia z8]PHK05755.1 hypothetical protein VF09_26295 [Nostoc linckia z9]PHK1906